MSARRIKAEQIKDKVMRVNENTFAIPSQTRTGKAHIVTIEINIPMISIPGDIYEEAINIINISNCSVRFNEFVKRSKDLIHRLTLYPSEKPTTTVLNCTCEDHTYRPDESCKHMLAVEMRLNEGDI